MILIKLFLPHPLALPTAHTTPHRANFPPLKCTYPQSSQCKLLVMKSVFEQPFQRLSCLNKQLRDLETLIIIIEMDSSTPY